MRLAVPAVLFLTALAAANIPPPPRIEVPCVRVMKLEKAQPDFKFYTLRSHVKGAELVPLELSAEKWVELPTKVEKEESAVIVYCVSAADAKKFEKPADLLVALKSGKVASGQLELPARLKVFETEQPVAERQVQHTLIVGERGKLSHTEVTAAKPVKPKEGPVPQPAAPQPPKTPFLLIGAFAALALVSLGVWFVRRR